MSNGRRKPDSEYRSAYRRTYLPDHPLAGASGIVGTHRFVLYEKIGPGAHPCHWCSAPVEWITGRGAIAGGLQVDHVDGNKLNNSPENLVPSCHVCNLRRGNKRRIKDPEVFLVAKDGTRGRATEIICDQCGTKFLVRLTRLKALRPGKVVRCSRICARRARM